MACGPPREVFTVELFREVFAIDVLIQQHPGREQPLVISRHYGGIFEARIIDIDEQNDIAILKPAWNSHPGLEIATSDRWKEAKKIAVAGYRPSDITGGANAKVSRQMSLQEETVVRTNGKGRYAIQLGSVKYPGKGWSGSAFVLPDTGAVVGVLSNERYVRTFFRKKHYIFGCSAEAIEELFRKNDLLLVASANDLPGRSRHRTSANEKCG